MPDGGLHNRGEFSKEMASMGCQIGQFGVERPEQLGRTEQHGGLLKAMVIRVIAELQLTGRSNSTHSYPISRDKEQLISGEEICPSAMAVRKTTP